MPLVNRAFPDKPNGAIVRPAEDEDAKYINAEHKAILRCDEEKWDRALNLGRRLNKKKAELQKETGKKYPGWNKWIKKNLAFSQVTTSRYMTFADLVDKEQNLTSRLLNFERKKELWASTEPSRSSVKVEEDPEPVEPSPSPPQPKKPPTSSSPPASPPSPPTYGVPGTPPYPPKPPFSLPTVPPEVEEEDEEQTSDSPPPTPPALPLPPEPSPAPPKRRVVEGKMGKRGMDVFTLDDWKALPKARQLELLHAQGTSKFNNQSTDMIEWALWSVNPVTGCRHDCPYCYARDGAKRRYTTDFEPSIWPNRLNAPHITPFPEGKIKSALAEGTASGQVRALGLKNVFVCSMADLFGRWVPSEWIETVLRNCAEAPQWNFLFLTKFPNRMSDFTFSDNCWVGTTVDCQARVRNAEKAFRKVKAGVKWLSCEPLIEPLHFQDLGAFQWVVIGGSSRSTQTPEWHPPRRWITDLEHEVWRTGGKVYEKTNLYPCDVGEARVREYPGIDFPLVKAPEQLVYLPAEIS